MLCKAKREKSMLAAELWVSYRKDGSHPTEIAEAPKYNLSATSIT